MSFADLVARQAGVISRAQAVETGMSLRTVQRRIADNTWTELLPRVYLVGGHPVTDEVRVRAAALWAGPAGLISGPAAAFWHGMRDRAPRWIEVTLPSSCHRRAPRGVRIRRRDVLRPDRTVTRGVAATAKPVTALETAIAVPDGSAFLDRALQRHVRFPAAYRAYCRNLGCRGSASIGRLIVAAADRADSAAERLLITLLRRAGVSGWTVALAFGPFVIDIGFAGAKIAVEVDGWAWHVDVERFRADRRKGNALAAAGWTVLRYTWHDLTGRPSKVVAEIRAELLRRAA